MTKEFKDVREYLKFQMRMYQLIKLPENKWLKPKELNFFVETILMHIENIDINSTDGLNEIRDRLNLKSTDTVYTYRTLIKRKGWFYRDNNGFNIKKIFLFTKSNFLFNIAYKFNIKLSVPL